MVPPNGSCTDNKTSLANQEDEATDGEETSSMGQVRWAPSTYADAVKNGLSVEIGESNSNVALTTLK
jgi:hypothetical protein